MAHFAQLDENNVVIQVIVVGNEQLKGTVTTEVDGLLVSQTVESEAKGIEFLKSLYGADTVWKQTSYNGKFRGAYAAVGGTFQNGEFVAPPVEFVAPPVLATEQIQSLSSEQIQSLSSAQVQSLSTAQISALGA